MNSRRLALLLTALCLPLSALADEWAPNLTAMAAWQSNASQADRGADRIDGLQFNADVLSSQRYAYGRDDTLYLRAHLGCDWWPRFDQLLSGAAGGRAEWRHQFGPSPRAFVVAVEGAADAVAAKETGRRGVKSGVTASVRKRLDDLTRISAWHEVAWMFARYGVYDSAASESAIELERDLTPETRLTFTARFRDGDVVSYARDPRPELAGVASSQLPVTTFGHEMTAYRVDATTWSGRLALIRALNETTAVVLAYERRETKRSALRFSNDFLSVGFVHQF